MLCGDIDKDLYYSRDGVRLKGGQFSLDSNLDLNVKNVILFTLITLDSSAIDRLTSSFFISSSLLQKTRKVIHERIQSEAKI
jgi:hypothetical protein